jgi:4-amino-4-deoxy-L-arabinose transferase-like glycosyltransferase
MSVVTAVLAQFQAARPAGKARWLLYGSLFGIGFVLRFAFMLWHKLYVFPPAAIYEVSSIAAHIARGQGFSSPFGIDTGPTAWIAPAYPYFVAGIFKIFGIYSATSMAVVLGVQCLMAAATGVTLCILGQRTLGPGPGFWASCIWTVSPFFFRWPTSWIWDFPASALLLTIVLILTLDVAEKGDIKHWLRLGALWGVSALTNPALLSMLPFTMCYAAFMNSRAKRKWVLGLSLAAALFAAMIAPWLIRNEVVFGHPVFLKGNYWFEFHLGNYHYSNGMGFSGKHPTQNPRELRHYVEMGEQGYIQWAKNDAFQFVGEYPSEFWNLTIHRVWWFWDGTPMNYTSHEWWRPWKFWPLSGGAWLGLIFVLTRRVRGWFLYAVPLALYPVPYYLSYCSSRYRHAIEPELLLISVYFAYVVWGEVRPVIKRVIARGRTPAAHHEVEVHA